MQCRILEGKSIASTIQQEVREAVGKLQGRPPCLAVIIVGNHPASEIYVSRKVQACEDVGIRSLKLAFPETISEHELIYEIEMLNADPSADAILVQLPLPAHINPLHIAEAIAPSKDVDGLHPENLGRLLMGDPDGIAPCTPMGMMALLERSGIKVAGKHAVIIGRSLIVGKPMAALLLKANASVTQLHSQSERLPEICRTADLIIAAVGKPRFLTKEMVKQGAAVLDVGINRVDGKLVGDADFDALLPLCSAITPVPGGIGPLTIAELLANTLKCYKKQL